MKSLAFSRRVANQRPYPTSSGGTGGTLIISSTAIAAVATPSQRAASVVVSFDRRSTATGTSVIIALIAASAISRRCDVCVPSHAMISKLPNSAPMIPPTVFAAYALPTSRAGSFAPRPTAASASGKLAPQSTAAGNTDHRQRTRSIWNVVARRRSPGPGSPASTEASWSSQYAAHAIAPVSSSWQRRARSADACRPRERRDPRCSRAPRPRGTRRG